MEHITKFPRWEHWEDETAKKEYERTMGISSIDIGSRKQLLKKLIPRFKKKSPAYKLKKYQLQAIWKKQETI